MLIINGDFNIEAKKITKFFINFFTYGERVSITKKKQPLLDDLEKKII
jgi:hypothetical protein